MAEAIDTAELTLGHALEVEANVKMWKLPATLGSNYGKIHEYASAQSLELINMPFARYVDIDWQAEASRGALGMIWQLLSQKIHFYSGRFVDKASLPPAPLTAHEYPARAYLRTRHIGPYAQVGKTYKRLIAHAQQAGLTLAPESIEHYIDDPVKTDKNALRTEVLIALR